MKVNLLSQNQILTFKINSLTIKDTIIEKNDKFDDIFIKKYDVTYDFETVNNKISMI